MFFYFRQVAIFLALLELCRHIVNVNVRNPTGTPAPDNKGPPEGRYVERYPTTMTNAALAGSPCTSEISGSSEMKARASKFPYDVT